MSISPDQKQPPVDLTKHRHHPEGVQRPFDASLGSVAGVLQERGTPNTAASINPNDFTVAFEPIKVKTTPAGETEPEPRNKKWGKVAAVTGLVATAAALVGGAMFALSGDKEPAKPTTTASAPASPDGPVSPSTAPEVSPTTIPPVGETITSSEQIINTAGDPIIAEIYKKTVDDFTNSEVTPLSEQVSHINYALNLANPEAFATLEASPDDDAKRMNDIYYGRLKIIQTNLFYYNDDPGATFLSEAAAAVMATPDGDTRSELIELASETGTQNPYQSVETSKRKIVLPGDTSDSEYTVARATKRDGSIVWQLWKTSEVAVDGEMTTIHQLHSSATTQQYKDIGIADPADYLRFEP